MYEGARPHKSKIDKQQNHIYTQVAACAEGRVLRVTRNAQ